MAFLSTVAVLGLIGYVAWVLVQEHHAIAALPEAIVPPKPTSKPEPAPVVKHHPTPAKKKH